MAGRRIVGGWRRPSVALSAIAPSSRRNSEREAHPHAPEQAEACDNTGSTLGRARDRDRQKRQFAGIMAWGVAGSGPGRSRANPASAAPQAAPHCRQSHGSRGMTHIPNSIQARDIESLVHPQTNLALHRDIGPVVMDRGEGIAVYDDAGNRFIDAAAGLWCASLGYASARLAKVA